MITYSVIFCDDIRQEVSGKHLIVGAYSGNLIPSGIPGTFPLSVLIKIQGLEGRHRFVLRLLAPDGSESARIEDDLDVPNSLGGFPIVFVGAPMTITKSGEIVLEMSMDSEPPQKIGTLTVQTTEEASKFDYQT